jgi:ATP-dependent Clp protease ATP-binding subunit ClpC
MNRMKRFTQRARRVLSLAQEEAQDLKHAAIGIEHLFAGLNRAEGGVASTVLQALGLSIDQVQAKVASLTSDRPQLTGEQIYVGDDLEKTLELAVDEAQRMGDYYIGTEHLLLGLCRAPGSATLLEAFNLTPEDVRRQVRQTLQQVPGQARPVQPVPGLRIVVTDRERSQQVEVFVAGDVLIRALGEGSRREPMIQTEMHPLAIEVYIKQEDSEGKDADAGA